MTNSNEQLAKEIECISVKDIDQSENVISITDAFRFLRNSCGRNPEIQNNLLKNSDLLSNTKKILIKILRNENSSPERVLCLQIGLQFLANLIVNNANNQKEVWLSCQDLFTHCLKYDNPKVQNYCAMIFYNLFLGNPEYVNELPHPLEDLIELTMKENTSEFAIYTLELFVLKSKYIEKYYDNLKPECKLLMLEVIKSLITDQRNQSIKPEIIQYFSNQFTKKSDCILKTCQSYADTLDPVEIVKILDLLVAFSSNDHYLNALQKQASLLINCIMLLKNMHSISKQRGNNFSMVNKLSELNKTEKDASIQEHPAFGFKGSLIRLIGNLCWKNLTNQNKVRELDCITVILDCCNIDARNPFIIQWCILAIRNICEKNNENQKVIASMSKEGKIDAARLREIGVMLNGSSNGEGIYIAPLNSKNVS